MCIIASTVSFSSMPHARRLQNAPDYRRPVSRWGGDNAATMSMLFCIPLSDTRTLNSWRAFLSTPGTAFRTRRCHFDLFYNLCSSLENRSTSSVACAPDFWIKSDFWSLALIDSSVSQETGRFELLLGGCPRISVSGFLNPGLACRSRPRWVAALEIIWSPRRHLAPQPHNVLRRTITSP